MMQNNHLSTGTDISKYGSKTEKNAVSAAPQNLHCEQTQLKRVSLQI